jgi:aryl-phospho-beta-D-glucosidase BglC (GH1 family)
VLKAPRFALIAFIALLAIPAAAAHAATRMPIGFFDDPSFRWSPTRTDNLREAAATGASVIHTTASWPALAPTKPTHATDGSDPAYRLGDLDDLVFQASLYGLRVMVNVTGTPKWANGGKAPNVMPTRVADLTAFTRMLATRYNGNTGHGAVDLWSIWNEPNLQLFLTPQFAGKKIVGPANYAKLYKAAYAGIKAGNPAAKVAIGETSARGRDKPLAGISASIAPGTFARLLSQQKSLKFDA